MEWLDIPEDEPIVARSVSKAIESSQLRVEGQNFDARKNLLEYDNVMNQQRKTIYALRRQVMGAEDLLPLIETLIDDVVYNQIDRHCPQDARNTEWDIEGLEDSLYNLTGLDIDLSAVDNDFARLEEAIVAALLAEYKDRRRRMIESIMHSLDPVDPNQEVDHAELERFAAAQWIYFERETYLRAIDALWKDHLRAMDALKEGVYLRAYAQKDPKLVYKKEGYDLFTNMVHQIRSNVADDLFHVEVKSSDEIAAMQREAEQRRARAAGRMLETHVSADALHAAAAGAEAEQAAGGAPVADGMPAAARHVEPATPVVTVRRTRPKIGRNDPCWCGSGKKYKKCHQASDEAELFASGGASAADAMAAALLGDDDDEPPATAAP